MDLWVNLWLARWLIRSTQTNDLKIGTCRFLVPSQVLNIIMIGEWLQCQDNVIERDFKSWCQWGITIKSPWWPTVTSHKSVSFLAWPWMLLGCKPPITNVKKTPVKQNHLAQFSQPPDSTFARWFNWYGWLHIYTIYINYNFADWVGLGVFLVGCYWRLWSNKM